MIGYVVLGTNDLARAASFYDELLAEMGVTRMMEFGERGYAWGVAMDKPMLCIMTPYDRQPATVGNGVMVGISAESRDQVDRIYNKAIELGGSDENSAARTKVPPDCAPKAATVSTPPTSATWMATNSTSSAMAEVVRILA
jgi:predicted lactoylglutathione lyase